MEELKLHCHGCGGSFARDELQYRPSGRGAYRRDLYFCPILPYPLPLPRFLKPCRHALGIWPTSAGRLRMIIKSNRIPSHVNEKVSHVLSLYSKGDIKPCRIKCGNLSLKIGRKWRLLSRNNGTCWEVMSHEKYNQLKDRKAQS